MLHGSATTAHLARCSYLGLFVLIRQLSGAGVMNLKPQFARLDSALLCGLKGAVPQSATSCDGEDT